MKCVAIGDQFIPASVIDASLPGRDWVTEYKSYFINYSESKLYVCEKQKITRVRTQDEVDPEIKIVVKVYDLDKKEMKKLKEFIESENTTPDGGTIYSIARKGKVESEIAHTAKFESLIKDLTK